MPSVTLDDDDDDGFGGDGAGAFSDETSSSSSYPPSFVPFGGAGTFLPAATKTETTNGNEEDDGDYDENDLPLSGIAAGRRFVVSGDPEEELSGLLDGGGQPPPPPPLRWDVYVCQSKPCLERGSAATLDAFVGLCPPGAAVTVHPAILSRSKKGGKGREGPIVRCIATRGEEKDPTEENEKIRKKGGVKDDDGKLRAFEVQNVDSVDKVYRILTKHMEIEGIDSSAAECLKYTYKGNAHLEKGELSDAIESYDMAVSSAGRNAPPQREGQILLMRATAYLKRAFRHQVELKGAVSDLADSVPDPGAVGALYGTVMAAAGTGTGGTDQNPSSPLPLATAAFRRVASDARSADAKFRLVKYRHGLYEYALLRAARDALRSTQLLPGNARAWLRAGDALAELRKLRESARYYERAMELDPALEGTLVPVIDRLERSQDFLDKARANGWSEDTLRLALDVAG